MADSELHKAISLAAGNKMLADMVEAISVGIYLYIKDARVRLMRGPQNSSILLKQHKAIVQYINIQRKETAKPQLKKWSGTSTSSSKG